jgi:hypothetical protein
VEIVGSNPIGVASIAAGDRGRLSLHGGRVSAGRRRFQGWVVALRIDRGFADELTAFGDHTIVGLRDDLGQVIAANGYNLSRTTLSVQRRTDVWYNV